MYFYFLKYLKFSLKMVVNHLRLNIICISLKINYRFEQGLQGYRHWIFLCRLHQEQKGVDAERSGNLPCSQSWYLDLQGFLHLFILWFCFINILSITVLTLQNKSSKLQSSVKVFSIIHYRRANSSLFCSSACLCLINHGIRCVLVQILCYF